MCFLDFSNGIREVKIPRATLAAFNYTKGIFHKTISFCIPYSPKLSFFTYICSRNEPCHFCRRGQLPINKTFDFRLGPTVVDKYQSEHVPFSRLEFVFDAMLVPFSCLKANSTKGNSEMALAKCSNITFHFHGGENETISDEMR